MNPYIYEDCAPGVELRMKKDTSEFLHYEVRFDSALDTGYTENSIVQGEYYQPKTDGKVPLAVLIHGMGDFSVIPCKLLARSLLKQGIACFIPYLTIHSRRIPKAMLKNMPYLNPEEWFQVYRVSVVDIRQIVDWAYTRNELDTGKIVTTGISFGGFVSAIAMGIDKRIKAGVFLVTGGNSNKISWLSKSRQYRKRFPRTEEEHLRIQESFYVYLKDVDEQGFENATPSEQSFLTDPLTYAGYLRDRPVLMINARKDKYIPVETVNELWRACGEPELKWIPSGHTTIWLWYPTIRRIISGFIKSVNTDSR